MHCVMCPSRKKLEKELITDKYNVPLLNITLHGVAKSQCGECGEAYYNFGDMEGLDNSIAECLIKKKGSLTGKEIKFLRKHLHYSSATLAKLVGYSAEHLSRIENGETVPQKVFDLLIRTLALEKQPSRDYVLQDLFLEDKLVKVGQLEFYRSSIGEKWKLVKDKKKKKRAS